jgi:hypothetical protein
LVEHLMCGVRVELDDGADVKVAPDWDVTGRLLELAGSVERCGGRAS